MLRPAHIGHLAMLRSLIRDAARDGAFDPALAWDSPAAARLFGELRQALKSGYFVVAEPGSRTVRTVAVPGYVYWADETAGSEPPVGFGLFRAIDDGYELWLTGLDAPLRGKGHGRALLQALFSTPTGRKTRVMRVRRSARSAGALAHLLAELGFTATRETDRETYFVRVASPPAVTPPPAPSPRRPLH